MNARILPYILVAAGGFLGAVLRWSIEEQVPSLWGTLAVNFLGCVAMGMFMYESIYIGNFSRETRIFFSAGFVGAFTTFSVFAMQSFQAGPVPGIVNILASLVLGLIGILAGRHLISYQRWM
ncbi:MAG: fluoride efflux transporter CrcB [Syntrophaceae bacterium]